MDNYFSPLADMISKTKMQMPTANIILEADLEKVREALSVRELLNQWKLTTPCEPLILLPSSSSSMFFTLQFWKLKMVYYRTFNIDSYMNDMDIL